MWWVRLLSDTFVKNIKLRPSCAALRLSYTKPLVTKSKLTSLNKRQPCRKTLQMLLTWSFKAGDWRPNSSVLNSPGPAEACESLCRRGSALGVAGCRAQGAFVGSMASGSLPGGSCNHCAKQSVCYEPHCSFFPAVGSAGPNSGIMPHWKRGAKDGGFKMRN